jgi:OPA family glycerol-3-phosphate transporter-like MFS transporter
MRSPKPAASGSFGAGVKSRLFRWTGTDPVYERWRWQIFSVTWLAYAGFNLTRKSFPVAKIDIGSGTAIGLTGEQMAWVDGAFLLAYAIGQFFWGIAGDRFGARKVILTGMFCSVIVGAAMGTASSATAFAVCFFIQGLCQSSGWAPLLKNVGTFFSRRERGFFLGLWCTNYAIGGLVASALAGYVGELFGWRFAFFIPAAVLLGIWCLFFAFQRNRPEDAGLPPIEVYHREPQPVVKPGDLPEDEPEGSWKVIGAVMANPVILLLGVVYFFLKPARYAILFWGPKYINDRLGAGMAESGFLSGLFELAGPASVLIAGFISDRYFGTRRVPISVICLVLLAGLLFVLDDLPHTAWVLAVGLFVLGFLVYAPDMMVSGIAAVDFGTKKGASTASGFINGLGSIGAVLGGTLPGFLQSRWGWEGVFSVLAVSVLVAAALLLPKWNALPTESQ